jgi:hypothetical protein
MGQRAVGLSMVPGEVFQQAFRGLHCDECTLFKVSGYACCGLARRAPMPAQADPCVSTDFGAWCTLPRPAIRPPP